MRHTIITGPVLFVLNMAKKTQEEKTGDAEQVERLRDELFKYRVEIQSYKRSINILVGSVSVILAIFAFFGYDRIESIVNSVEARANARLATTDSLLAKVDMRFLDSLTSVVNERTILYENAIEALERGARVNKDIYKQLIGSLPYNKRIDKSVGAYTLNDATNLFDVVYYTDDYHFGGNGDCYVLMGEEYAKHDEDMFLVIVRPKGRNIAICFQPFEAMNDYNKLHFGFAKYEKYTEYELSIILLRGAEKNLSGYGITLPVSTK